MPSNYMTAHMKIRCGWHESTIICVQPEEMGAARVISGQVYFTQIGGEANCCCGG